MRCLEATLDAVVGRRCGSSFGTPQRNYWMPAFHATRGPMRFNIPARFCTARVALPQSASRISAGSSYEAASWIVNLYVAALPWDFQISKKCVIRAHQSWPRRRPHSSPSKQFAFTSVYRSMRRRSCSAAWFNCSERAAPREASCAAWQLAIRPCPEICSGPDSGPLQASCSAWQLAIWQLAVLGVQVYDVYSGARSPVVVK